MFAFVHLFKDQSIILLFNSRPGEDMNYGEVTEKKLDDDEDPTDHLPISSHAMCPYEPSQFYRLNFLITTNMLCDQCNLTVVCKISDKNKFLFNYNVHYRSQILCILINCQSETIYI